MRQTTVRTPTSRLTSRTHRAARGRRLIFLAVCATYLLLGASPALAQDGDSVDPADDLGTCIEDPTQGPVADTEVRVVKVAGLLDPVVASNLLTQLDGAEANPNVVGFIIWVNSRGSILGDDDYLELAERLRDSPVDTALWVGLAGSTAQGGTAELATVVDVVGVTPNSTIGRVGERRLPSEWGDPFAGATADVETALLNADEAVQAEVSVGPLQNTVPIGSFATQFDGYEVLQCLNDAGDIETRPVSQVQLSGLSLVDQLFHTAASPEVAYLFFVMGLSLLLFELFTAGVGIAGVLGAGFLALGAYGLAILPTRWWAIALLLLTFVLLAVDVQTNVPRFYTVAGLAVLAVGTLFLYDGVSQSWVTIAAVWIGAILYAYTGMPSMVRTRFSTPTIGRKWMIGEVGEAISDIDPDGTVKIRDAAWRATTNRATPVESGGRVRVIGIDRLVLEIEPEEGGARDYRERS